MVTIFYSDEFLKHETGLHPECPARLSVIVKALQEFPWPKPLIWRSPTAIDQREVLSWVKKLHTTSYIQRVQAIAEGGGGGLDLDTPISSKSYEVALLAVSAWLDGVDRVLGDHDPSFVLARPPGHHAISSTG
ncbi:MAG: histone deacetylase, partial [Microcystaceae cyanobacterium]